MANIFDTLDAPADTKNVFDSIPASYNSFDGLPHDVPSFEELKEAGALPREGLTPHMLNQERQAESNRQVLAAGGDVLPSDKELMEKHLNDALMTGDEMEALGLPRWLAPVERGVATSASGMSDPANIAYAAMPGAAPAFIGSMAYDSAKNLGKGAYHVVTGQGEQGAQELTEGALGAMIPAMVARSGMKESARDASSAISGEPAAPLPDVDATARQNLSIKDAPAQVVQPAPKSQNIFDALDEKPIEAPVPAPAEQAKPIGTLNDIIGSKLDEIKSLLQKQQPEGEPNATANAQVEQQTADVPVSAERNEPQGTGAIREVPATEEADATENEPANAETEPLNPGGAESELPPEPAPSEDDASGPRNSITAEKRDEMELPEATPHTKRGFQQIADEAEARGAANASAGIDLVNELRDKPRPMTDTEVGTLAREQLRREQAVDTAAKAVNEAADDGARQEASVKLSKALDDAKEVYDVGKKAGTLSAQGLNARRIMLNQDFSLSRMMDLKRAVSNKGERLTDAQAKEVADLHAKIEATQKAHEDYVNQANKRISKMQADSELAKAQRETPAIDPVVKRIVDRIGNTLHTQRDAALARIKARAGNLNAGIDPTQLADYAVVGASHIFDGAKAFADWSKRMVETFGESIKPHLEGLFKASNDRFDTETDKAAGAKSEGTRKLVRNMTNGERISDLSGKISEKLKAGKNDEITTLVQKLSREFVARGVSGRDALIDEVHGALSKLEPDLSRRDVMDMISGYGDFKQLSKDEVSVKLRDLKGQMQQVAKLEDMQSGKAPSKTGIERRAPSEEERQLIKQVNEMKKREGLSVTDPATQIKSALESRKTYYRNQIEDFQKQIDSKEKLIKTKTPSPTDAELVELKGKRDALKKEFEDIFGKSGLTDEQRLNIAQKALERSIADKQERLASGDVQPKSRQVNRPLDPQLEKLAQQRDALNEQIKKARSKPEDQLEAESLKRNLDLINRLISKRQAKLDAGDLSTAPRSQNRPMSPELEKAKQELESVNQQIQEARDALTPKKTKEEISLAALKTRLKNQTEEYERRLREGDFSKRPKPEIKIDEKALELQAANERAKQKFKTGLELDRLKNRTPYEKAMDTLVKWRRGFLLSGPVTLAKLTSAALQRVAFSPLEEAAGGAISKAFPAVASKAAREGGFNAHAEAKAITEGFTTGMKDAWQVLKTGRSNLDTVYGHRLELPPSAIDFFGNVHGALKTVAKRAEFARSFEKRVASAIANGVDPTDPLIQTKIAVEAYKDANKAIFMQDNRVVDAYKSALGRLEAKDKSTGQVPLKGKLAGTISRTLLPIVKVPTNIVAETMRYATGAVTGSARLATAYAKGIESLKPEQAEQIMGDLKKGAIGAAVLLLGYWNADKIGGYYQPGKRDKEDVNFGSARVFGHDLPSYVLHNPLLEMLQIGATVRRVAESYASKKAADKQGLGAGVEAAAFGLLGEVPFAREAADAGKLLDSRERPAAEGRIAKSVIVPAALSSAAQYFDKDANGKPIERKPTGLKQYVETGIPGLRQNVPVKKK